MTAESGYARQDLLRIFPRMQMRKTRHQFYLPDALSQKLAAMAAKPGASKSAIMTDALTAWFERRGAHELDDRFGARLDRHSRSADRMERKLDYVIEALGLFVHQQLTLTAHQPAFDDETRHLGRLRYNEFVRIVGRLVARGETALLAGESEREGTEP